MQKISRDASVLLIRAIFALALTVCNVFASPNLNANADADAGADAGANATANTDLDTLITAAKKSGFAGTVLVTDRHKLIYERVVGLADRERNIAHNTTEIWRWASVTKQVTAIIVAQLIEEGKLSLDGNIANYLSKQEFKGKNAAQITIRQLLQHTSGLPNPDDVAADENIFPPLYQTKINASGANQFATSGICSGQPKRKPGERNEYNNCDYLVLGKIIEKISGKPFGAVVVERIAKPLGIQVSISPPGNNVRGYLDAKKIEPAFNLNAFGAAGSLVGSARDLAALDRALLGDKLMSAASKKIFWQGEPKLGYAALSVWAFPAQLKGCKESVELIERRGGIGGVQVRNVLIPSKDKAVIIFTNRGDIEFGEIWQAKGFMFDVLSAALCE